jgi:hypothetical protein
MLFQAQVYSQVLGEPQAGLWLSVNRSEVERSRWNTRQTGAVHSVDDRILWMICELANVKQLPG